MASHKKQFILLHISGIIIFLCLPLLFLSNGPENKSFTTIAGNSWFWMFAILYIGIFYLNAYWLFPGLYLQKQHVQYALCLLVLLIIVYLAKPFDHIISASPPPNRQLTDFNPGPQGAARKQPIDFVSLFLFMVVVALSILVQVIKQWQKTQQQFITIQKDKANAELSVLKAQVNPHFLFNTLNNLYSLALTNSEKTPESILRLSNIMRYVTDEVQHDLVPLENEIACINDFIELQKLRLNAKTTVRFTCTNINGSLPVAPLILLPFIENAFKHGVSNNENSTIEIKISNKERELLFYSSNTNFSHTKNNDREGTGIANVKKRLENLYPGKHFLKTVESAIIFEVHLIINT